MSIVERERQATEERATTWRSRIFHVAAPCGTVALCGAQRPEGSQVFRGWLDEQPNPCVVCLDLSYGGAA